MNEESRRLVAHPRKPQDKPRGDLSNDIDTIEQAWVEGRAPSASSLPEAQIPRVRGVPTTLRRAEPRPDPTPRRHRTLEKGNMKSVMEGVQMARPPQTDQGRMPLEAGRVAYRRSPDDTTYPATRRYVVLMSVVPYRTATRTPPAVVLGR